MFIRLDSTAAVAGQIFPADMQEIARQGFKLVINNRPDGEEPRQPSSIELSAAARAAGLSYRAIPISGASTAEAVAQMAEALSNVEGPVLAFCRSGKRSARLWSLASATLGREPDEIIKVVGTAGFAILDLRKTLDSCAALARQTQSVSAKANIDVADRRASGPPERKQA